MRCEIDTCSGPRQNIKLNPQIPVIIALMVRLTRVRKIAIPILNIAHYSGLYRIVGSVYGGLGVIFSMHRIAEPGRPTLYPGHVIHADVLDDILGAVRRLGWEIVSIDEVHRRLSLGAILSREGSYGLRRFACFTSDDGYADNLTLALPVFRKHNAQFCVYITTGQIERSIIYWPGANEELIFKTDRIDLPPIGDSGPRRLWARNFEEKLTAYRTLNELCHGLGDAFYPVLDEVYRQHGVDSQRSLDRAALTLAQARELASDPLVTIGCHCVTHQRLSLMTEAEARLEMEHGRQTLETWFDVEVRHLAYPYGRSDACGTREFALAKQAGFKTAVTTRQGNIFPGHRNYLECLPRRTIPLSSFKLRSVLFGVETILHNEPRFQTQ
jgi:peptidoglycan/xylan/chitin deacetylase (PgdA/CDA1 family)